MRDIVSYGSTWNPLTPMVLLCAMSNPGLSVPSAGVLSLVRKTTVHISGLVAARDKSIAALCGCV